MGYGVGAGMGVAPGARVGAGADEVSVDVAWLRKRLSQRLPRGCSLFIASNLHEASP